MGALVSRMTADEAAEAMGDFLDYRSSTLPGPDEALLFGEGERLFEELLAMRRAVKEYDSSAQEAVGRMMRTFRESPLLPEFEEHAWNHIVARLGVHEQFFAVRSRLVDMLPRLLEALTTPRPRLLDFKALTYTLSRLMAGLIEFDAVKLGCPSLQNDFAFYRRLRARDPLARPAVVDDNTAMSIMLQIGPAFPMVAAIEETLSRDPLLAQFLVLMSQFVDLCAALLEGKTTFHDDHARDLWAACMSVTAIVQRRLSAKHPSVPRVKLARIEQLLGRLGLDMYQAHVSAARRLEDA